MNFGEVPGVAVNSNGHVFVFSRSNSANGPAFGAAAAQLFECRQTGGAARDCEHRGSRSVGAELESARAPVEFVIIDGLEKPAMDSFVDHGERARSHSSC
jgi:hypothetical protein